MKRVLHAAGIVLAAATLGLTTATSAGAATGQLSLNDQFFQDPSGCYNAESGPLNVYNGTDQEVTVFGNADCTGPVNGTVDPGQSGNFDFGASVSVP
ncbi:hypothetical protein [Kitasatospora viridis]|uniref:Secreted protein n=1 Tax=Kitasatospora viridis TaxID=281105 RepID=A0A561T795_9ACTN|nr:hypothetical protein [Kitasatospora viridis]TWF82979.1 hypothetical protein FHX73_14462 [Kitasatospora viridis]